MSIISETHKALLFTERLTAIDNELSKGNLVTSDLQFVEKHGFSWTWIKLTKSFMSFFSCFTKKDPWQSFRIDALVRSLDRYTSKNTSHVCPEIQEKLKQILAKLQVKASHSKHKDVYERAINAFKIPNSDPDSTLPAYREYQAKQTAL